MGKNHAGERARVVLITGASSGIGRACAEYLWKRGCKVYGTSRWPEARRKEGFDPPFELIEMDVDDDPSVGRGVGYVLEREERLDVVVNNAGFGFAGAIEDTTLEEAKAQLETNFFGVLRVCKAVLPAMRQQKFGYIVNISSVAGIVSLPFQGMYSVSKFAVEAMSEALYNEVRCFGIHVVLIEPGNFKTEFTDHRQKTPKSQSQHSVYSTQFTNALSVMEREEKTGPDPRRVAALLERIITNPSPRLRYPVGRGSETVVIPLKNIVPSWLFAWVLRKHYKVA